MRMCLRYSLPVLRRNRICGIFDKKLTNKYPEKRCAFSNKTYSYPLQVSCIPDLLWGYVRLASPIVFATAMEGGGVGRGLSASPAT